MLEKFKKYFDYTMANIILAIIGITTIVAGLVLLLISWPIILFIIFVIIILISLLRSFMGP